MHLRSSGVGVLVSKKVRERRNCTKCGKAINPPRAAWSIVSLLGDIMYYHDGCVDQAGDRGRKPKH